MHERTDDKTVQRIFLCDSAALINSADAVSFDVVFDARACRAFAIRYQDQVYAYLNRCEHIAMEMDYQSNHFFDPTGDWLICATHGALYQPQTGACRMGPCRGGLIKIDLSEIAGAVHWHTADNLKPLAP
jgi:nitrite reductase/ring-hydroxylating ferredoxin subunit